MVVTIILDINGTSHVCRTFENESIQINKVVASVSNLGSQGTVTRQSFRLPLIGGLLDAIGDITDPSQSAKVNLNKSIKGRILVDGFERFTGSFFVVNTTKGFSKEVEMIFQGQETDLKATLSNITMAELFAGEKLLYNYTEMKQYFDAPDLYRDNNGYIFPLVNYGEGYTNISVFAGLKENQFKAATTFKKCFDLMPLNITATGIDNLMNQAILLHNNKSSLAELDTSPLGNTGRLTRSSNFITSSNSPFQVPFNAMFNYLNVVFSTTNNNYTAEVDGAHTFGINMNLALTKNNPSGGNINFQFFLLVKRSGLIINTVPLVWSQENVSGGVVTPFTRVDQTTVNLLSGDNVQINMHSFADATIVATGSEFSCISSPAFSPTSNIDIPANCPKLTAWDIFSTIVLQCNGQITSNQDGTYEITPWVDWIKDNNQVIILDNIIENNIDVQVKPFSVDGARSIRLGYKPNDDFYNKQFTEVTNQPFGQKLIENTGTEFAKNEINIQLAMSTVPHTKILSTNTPIPNMVDKDNKTVLGNAIILQTTSGTTSLSWTLRSIHNGSVTQYNSLPFTGNWGSIAGGYLETDSNFGQSLSYFSSVNYPSLNLYQRFWKDYLEETYSEQSREIKMNIKLTRNQIDGLNFNEKFYYKNTLLRLIKLEGISLTSNRPAKATFMKRFTIQKSDISGYYPTNVIRSVVQWAYSSSNQALYPADGSTANQTVLKASAEAYGFFYDSAKLIATQSGRILIT